MFVIYVNGEYLYANAGVAVVEKLGTENTRIPEP